MIKCITVYFKRDPQRQLVPPPVEYRGIQEYNVTQGFLAIKVNNDTAHYVAADTIESFNCYSEEE